LPPAIKDAKAQRKNLTALQCYPKTKTNMLVATNKTCGFPEGTVLVAAPPRCAFALK
jgi:hypothetical protein